MEMRFFLIAARVQGAHRGAPYRLARLDLVLQALLAAREARGAASPLRSFSGGFMASRQFA